MTKSKKATIASVKEMTFAQYEDALCAAARDIQGENYACDDYYRQGEIGPWRDNWEDGDDPYDAVWGDMSYWD
jgi:hypothetical protein